MPAEASVRERQASLRADPEIGRWYKAHRSESTARSQLAQLELFCRRVRKTPKEIARLGRLQAERKSKEFEDIVLRWIEQERRQGRPDSYISVNFAAVRSWLKHQESAPAWKPALKVRFGTTIVNEVVPTPEQLRAVLDRTPVPRLRALLLLLATSGIRIGAIGSEYSPNGLRLRNLPELSLKPEPHFTQVGPVKIEVPAELSKGGNPYFCYASAEFGTELLSYIESRINRGHKLTPEMALFCPEPKAPHAQERRAPDGVAFLSEKGLGNELRRMLRKVAPKGVRWRPYVLRSFASSQLMLAENAGLITRDAREFLLGHVADIGRRYNLAKGRVRSDIELEVRGMYSRAADRFLRVLTLDEKDRAKLLVKVELLKTVGYTEAEADAIARDESADIPSLVRRKLGAMPEAAVSPASRSGEQRVVDADLTEKYLEAGWTFKSPLNGTKAVVEWMGGLNQ